MLAVYTLPGNAFDLAGRGISITAAGSFAATGNNKRLRIVFNATTAVVGSTVTGGSIICDTGTIAQNGGGWQLMASVFKSGAAGSNTQIGIHNQAIVSTAVAPVSPQPDHGSGIGRDPDRSHRQCHHGGLRHRVQLPGSERDELIDIGRGFGSSRPFLRPE